MAGQLSQRITQGHYIAGREDSYGNRETATARGGVEAMNVDNPWITISMTLIGLESQFLIT